MQLAGLNDFTDFCSAQAFFINECFCHRISRIAPEADGSHGLAFRGLKLGLQFIIGFSGSHGLAYAGVVFSVKSV